LSIGACKFLVQMCSFNASWIVINAPPLCLFRCMRRLWMRHSWWRPILVPSLRWQRGPPILSLHVLWFFVTWISYDVLPYRIPEQHCWQLDACVWCVQSGCGRGVLHSLATTSNQKTICIILVCLLVIRIAFLSMMSNDLYVCIILF
jgi:hypothetical protein